MKPACLLFATLCSALLANVVQSQPLSVLDRGSVSLGLYASRISLDGKGEVDGTVDDRGRQLSDDFELGDYRLMKLGEVTWSPWARHEFSLRVLDDTYERTIQLSEEINFEEQTFPVEVDLRARTRFSSVELGYTWWAYATQTAAIGPQIGIMRLHAGLALSGTIEANDNGASVVDASASRQLYAPVIGIAGRWMATDRIRFYGQMRAIELRYKKIDGTALAASAGFDWYLSDRWGITAQYAHTSIRADYDRGIFDGQAELRLRGPQLLLKARW